MAFWQDLRFGARLLRRNPGFTLTATLTLALGIGATTAIFSVVDAILWKPLPLQHLDRLSAISQRDPSDPTDWDDATPADLADLKRAATSFESFSWYNGNLANLVPTNGEPERVYQARVSAGFFATVGAHPALGRTFAEGEDQPGRSHAVLLGDALWRRSFGADPEIAGRTVRLDGEDYEVIGVMPRGFAFPSPAELWTPLELSPREAQSRAEQILVGVARRKPGVSAAQAAAEVDTLSRALEREYPNTNTGRRLQSQTLLEFVTGGHIRQYMLMLLASVLLVLLIACVNVANLQLARSTGRLREVAVRYALGAGRGRVVRQLLTESLLLALGGAACGLLVAYWGVDLMRALRPSEMERHLSIMRTMALDGRAMAFTAAVAVLSGVLAGIAPALHASPRTLVSVMREAGRGASLGASRRRWRAALVGAEIALAVVLLIGAGLMVRGFNSLVERSAARQPETLLTFRLTPARAQYASDRQIAALYRDVLDRISALPGVRSAAIASAMPHSRHGSGEDFTIEGRVPQRGERPSGQYQVVSPRYFETLRVPLLEGRLLAATDGDDAPRVAVVSRRMVRQYWPHERSAIGRRLRIAADPAWWTVVGVVDDIQHSVFDVRARPVVYVPSGQAVKRWEDAAIRTAGDPRRLIPATVAAVRAVDPELPVTGIRTMSEALRFEAFGLTWIATLMGVFGAMALALSCVGVYGVMAYTVSEQTHDTGVRIALGARPRDVMGMVFRRGMLAAGSGIAAGLVAAVVLAQLLPGLVFGVGALDPATFLGIPVALFAAALTAIWIPARRAATVDPAVALRCE